MQPEIKGLMAWFEVPGLNKGGVILNCKSMCERIQGLLEVSAKEKGVCLIDHGPICIHTVPHTGLCICTMYSIYCIDCIPAIPKA